MLPSQTSLLCNFHFLSAYMTLYFGYFDEIPHWMSSGTFERSKQMHGSTAIENKFIMRYVVCWLSYSVTHVHTCTATVSSSCYIWQQYSWGPRIGIYRLYSTQLYMLWYLILCIQINKLDRLSHILLLVFSRRGSFRMRACCGKTTCAHIKGAKGFQTM